MFRPQTHMKTSSEIRLALGRAFTLGVAACALSAQAAITDGLVGHWTFNETSGATAKDTSGKGHDGAVSNLWGEDPAWTTGQIGGALSFRGPDSGGDGVIVNGLPAFTETFSVSAWVWADPRDGTWPESSIVSSSGLTVDGPVGLAVRLKDRDQAFGPLGNTTVDAGGSVVLNEPVGFPVSVWQQVGVVADGTRIHLYRNGVEVGTANYAPPLPDPISPELGIGVTPDDGGFPGAAFWQGKIDDAGIWTTPLTASQMASIFNAGQAGKDLTQADAYQNLPPTITTQPISISRFVGETAIFSVQAAGSGNLAVTRPDGLLVLAQEHREPLAIAGRQNNPFRPFPCLVGAPNSHVQDQPMQPAGTDVGPAEPVPLPRPRDGQMAALKTELLGLDLKIDASPGQVSDLDALVAVPIQPPGLRTRGVPETHRRDPGQHLRRQRLSWVTPPRQGAQAHLPSPNRVAKRLATVGPMRRSRAQENGRTGATPSHLSRRTIAAEDAVGNVQIPTAARL